MKKDTLDKFLTSHKLWIESGGKQGNRAILELANLRGAILEGANLKDARLRGAILSGAHLSGAHLSRAILEGANLEGADLTGVDLYDANLDYANLSDANLTRANLNGADLKGATGLPDVSWIKPGCLVQLNRIPYGFYLEDYYDWINFYQDSLGLIIKINPENETFDILIADKIFRGIPDWVKYSGIGNMSKKPTGCF